MTRRRPFRARAQRGMTMLELMIGVAIVGILAVTVIPSYDTVRARARLRGAAENLHADLQYARSEAVQRNSKITVVFATGTSWCYGINEGAATCDCSLATCSLKNVGADRYPTVSMAGAAFPGSSASGGRYSVDPRRGETLDASGASASGTVTLSGTGTMQVAAQVNAVGRVRLCSPSGSVPGYPSC